MRRRCSALRTISAPRSRAIRSRRWPGCSGRCAAAASSPRPFVHAVRAGLAPEQIAEAERLALRTTRRGCRSMIVGTAGHIDHGKTALVKALTGVDADRLGRGEGARHHDRPRLCLPAAGRRPDRRVRGRAGARTLRPQHARRSGRHRCRAPGGRRRRRADAADGRASADRGPAGHQAWRRGARQGRPRRCRPPRRSDGRDPRSPRRHRARRLPRSCRSRW